MANQSSLINAKFMLIIYTGQSLFANSDIHFFLFVCTQVIHLDYLSKLALKIIIFFINPLRAAPKLSYVHSANLISPRFSIIKILLHCLLFMPAVFLGQSLTNDTRLFNRFCRLYLLSRNIVLL